MPDYTADQEKAVLKVLSYSSLQYYAIIGCEKLASDGDIKKLYRRLAIKLHPDKNPHPRASEAFKLLNKAYGVLGDPSKKRIYDQTGADPDLRFAASSGGGAPAQGQSFRGFQSQASPEDLFNMFFGGGGGPGQTFTFGNNGFQFQSFGNGFGNGYGNGFDPFQTAFRNQRRPAPQRPPQPRGSLGWWMEMAVPIVMVLGIILLLFKGQDVPEYSFHKTSTHTLERVTPNHKVPFYVEKLFPVSKSAHKLAQFDRKVEHIYVLQRRDQCSREQLRRRELMEDARGWFFTDEARLERARNMPMPNCERLAQMGLL